MMKFAHEIDSSSWSVLHRLVAILDDGTRREGQFCKYDAPAFISDEEIAGLDVPAVPRDGFIAFTDYFDGECPRVVRYQETIFSFETTDVEIMSKRMVESLAGDPDAGEDEASDIEGHPLSAFNVVCDKSPDEVAADSYVKHGDAAILAIDPGSEVAGHGAVVIDKATLMASITKYTDSLKDEGPILPVFHHAQPQHRHAETLMVKVGNQQPQVVLLSEFRDKKETVHAPLSGLTVARHDDPTHREDEAGDHEFALKP